MNNNSFEILHTFTTQSNDTIIVAFLAIAFGLLSLGIFIRLLASFISTNKAYSKFGSKFKLRKSIFIFLVGALILLPFGLGFFNEYVHPKPINKYLIKTNSASFETIYDTFEILEKINDNVYIVRKK